MTLQQLKYVITVAEQRSITKAAEMLYISRPYMSKTIHELEREIGQTLFIRSGKGIQITQEGKQFVHEALKIVNQMIALENRYCIDTEYEKHFADMVKDYASA